MRSVQNMSLRKCLGDIGRLKLRRQENHSNRLCCVPNVNLRMPLLLATFSPAIKVACREGDDAGLNTWI